MAQYFRRAVSCGIVLATLCLAACTPKSVQSLQSMLAISDWSLVYPYKSTNIVYPGGLVVGGKEPTFYGLPTLHPQTNSGPVSWPATTDSGSLTLEALVSGLGKLGNGGFSGSHSPQTILKEIDGNELAIVPTAQSILADSAVSKQVKQWQQSGLKVYLVYSTATTTSISITTTSSTGISAAYGTSLPTCTTPPVGTTASGGGATSAGSTTASGDTNQSVGSTPATGAIPAAETPTEGSGSTTGAASTTSTTTASLQACTNSSSQLTLSTTTPLVFAAEVRLVRTLHDGTLDAPQDTIIKPMQVNHSGAKPKLKNISIVNVKPWPRGR